MKKIHVIILWSYNYKIKLVVYFLAFKTNKFKMYILMHAFLNYLFRFNNRGWHWWGERRWYIDNKTLERPPSEAKDECIKWTSTIYLWHFKLNLLTWVGIVKSYLAKPILCALDKSKIYLTWIVLSSWGRCSLNTFIFCFRGGPKRKKCVNGLGGY
jgi:hypothetical protein